MKKWIIALAIIAIAGLIIGYGFAIIGNKNTVLVDNENNVLQNNTIENKIIENIVNEVVNNTVENVALNNNVISSTQPTTESGQKSKAEKTTVSYGTSGAGRKLTATKIVNNEKGSQGEDLNNKKVILLNFAIHGFEDHHAKDGQILVSMADNLTTYLMNNPELLNGWMVYIIRCANPDGLNDGTTNNGPGRCQTSKGIDLNRDFPYNFKTFNDARNKTLDKPLSAPESKALYDFTLSIKPTIVLDIHGWEDNTLGSSNITKYFKSNLSLGANKSFSNSTGYFSAWATTIAKDSALIELPMPESNNNSAYVSKYSNKFNSAVKELLKNY